MSDTLSIDDVEKDVKERDSDGELLPETHTIEYNGEQKDVKTVPLVTGTINKLSHVDDEIANLEPSAVLEALQELYIEPDFSGWTEGKVEAYDVERLSELLAPLDEKVEEDIGETEGNPMNMDRQERAEQMR